MPGVDFEDVEIAALIMREALIDLQACRLCHTDLLFATHDIVRGCLRSAGSTSTGWSSARCHERSDDWHTSSDFLYRLTQLGFTGPGDEVVSALIHKVFGRGNSQGRYYRRY